MEFCQGFPACWDKSVLLPELHGICESSLKLALVSWLSAQAQHKTGVCRTLIFTHEHQVLLGVWKNQVSPQSGFSPGIELKRKANNYFF